MKTLFKIKSKLLPMCHLSMINEQNIDLTFGTDDALTWEREEDARKALKIVNSIVKECNSADWIIYKVF